MRKTAAWRSIFATLCVLITCFSVMRAAPAQAAGQPAAAPALRPSVTWAGRWIWANTDTANQWVAFRTTVNLASVPSTVVTDIATDTKYWLYVNGTLVTFEGGLKRGPNPNDTYYDEKDIASYLTTGTNTIALLVWHFGKSGFSHKDSGAAGVLFQSPIAVSDTSWRAIVHPGYGNDTSGGQPNYRLAESNVYYDARNAGSLANWQATSYDDSAWGTATDKGAPNAAPYGALVARPIPFFRYTGLQSYTNSASLPTTGQGSTAIVATLPSNLQVTPYLKVNAPAGSVIGIQTDHYTDGGGNNVRATYITTGGTQEFESLGWMSGTAVQYTIPTGVQILALSYRESGYDTAFAGSFTSNDAFMNTLWTKSERTVYLNLRDNFMDCPTRERAQWWGDAVSDLKEGFYGFDTKYNQLGDKAINELVNWQRGDSTLYSPVPSGNWNQELPVQMLASIWSFGTFYQYTGDSSTFANAYPHVKSYMNLWSLDSDGLVNHRAGNWDWEDWGSNIDARVLDNAWYYLALGTTIQLANLTGHGSDVAALQAKQNSISTNFNRVLWNGTNNEYRSPGYTGDTDDRANAMAVVTGLADAPKYASVINVLNHHQNASPWTELYVLEAYYLMHDANDAEARMRARYAAEVSDPGYTVWELWSKGGGGTDNHGWAAGPMYALSAYAAGVKPTAAGYSTYTVAPQIGDLTAIDQTVATVKGNVTVSTRLPSATHFTMAVTSPSNTTARIGVPTLGLTGVTIKANNTTVYANGGATGSVSGLSYAGSDANYVYFTVNPGTWSFDETGTSSVGANLALNKTATSNNSLTNSDWGIAHLTDGTTTSVSGAKGYTSNGFGSSDASGNAPYVDVDLGANQTVNEIKLYPRTDTGAAGGGTANFPVNFTIQTAPDGGAYTTTTTITGQANPNGVVQAYAFPATTARHVRVSVTKLGTPASDETSTYRLQLAEMQVYNATDMALNKTASSNNSLESGPWGIARLTDGVQTSNGSSNGYTSNTATTADVSGSPIYVDVDLGGNQSISSVTLFPRTGVAAVGGGSPNFPVNFTVQVAPDGGSFTTVATITGQANPNGAAQSYSFAPTSVRHVRVVATLLGSPASDEGISNAYRLQLAELQVQN